MLITAVTMLYSRSLELTHITQLKHSTLGPKSPHFHLLEPGNQHSALCFQMLHIFFFYFMCEILHICLYLVYLIQQNAFQVHPCCCRFTSFLRPNIYMYAGFPSGSEVKNSSVMQEAQERQVWSLGQGVRKIPQRKKWQPTSIVLPESHGQRNLAGYSPLGHKESDRTEATEYTHTHIYTHTYIYIYIYISHIFLYIHQQTFRLFPYPGYSKYCYS